jgi:4-hydroxyphenylpyruvate dioxygenase
MQIFTKPLSDRPTVFVEIIQRIGCEREVPSASPAAAPACSIDCRGSLL